MKRLKFTTVLFIALTVLIAQVGAVFAAPDLEGTTIDATIIAIECITDFPPGESDGPVTIVVTIQDSDGVEHIVELDEATAESLGLISVVDGIVDLRPPPPIRLTFFL